MNANDPFFEQLVAENIALKETNNLLGEQIKLLEERISCLEKDSTNSSKPLASDIEKPQRNVKAKPRKKRNLGGQSGHRKFSRPAFKSEEIDSALDHGFADGGHQESV